MINFEKDHFARDRHRERIREAEHERLARAARRAAAPRHGTTRRGWALALMRRIVRAAAA